MKYYENEIKSLGARQYVGGLFEEIGKWQFDLITKNQTLSKQTRFLDVACGCFRLGKHMIDYLDDNHYYGFDIADDVVNHGINQELREDQKPGSQKNPTVWITDTFDLSKVSEGYDLAWANSLFSHLDVEDIQNCFEGLNKVSEKNNTFMFTYFNHHNPEVVNGNQRNWQGKSHSNRMFVYSLKEMQEIAGGYGWEVNPLQTQTHPRGQLVVKSVKIS